MVELIEPGRIYPAHQFFDLLAGSGQAVVPGSGRWIEVNDKAIFAVALEGAVEFKAANERAWAAVFDALGVGWKYEALEPEMARALRYQPDFWLTERYAWVEIKSSKPTPGEVRVARELLEADGHPVYILTGWPGRGKYRVSLFHTAGDVETQRPDYCNLALCHLFDCKFGELEAAFGQVRKGYRGVT